MPYPYSAGAVLLAADLNTDFAAKYDSAPAINAQVGTTYTFVLADATAGKTITASNSSASTYTVPPQSSVAFSAGALLRVTNLGVGIVAFAAGAGVTVTNAAATLSQYQTATLVRTGSDAWTVVKSGGAGGLTFIASATISAASSTIISNCFSATYDAYLMVVDNLTSSLGADFNIQFRTGVTTASTGYNDQYFEASAATTAGARATAQANATVGFIGTTSPAQYNVQINGPFLARATMGSSFGGANLTSTPTVDIITFSHTTATSYESLVLSPSTGTFSATVRIYGIANA